MALLMKASLVLLFLVLEYLLTSGIIWGAAEVAWRE